MNTFLISILAFAISAGQLIRIPFGRGGITLLDITVFLFCLAGLIKNRFHFKKIPLSILSALIFLGVAVISLVVTPLNLTTTEYLNSFSYAVRFSFYILFTWLIILEGFGNFGKNLTKAFLISGVAFAALGLLQFIFFPNLDFLVSAGWDPHYFRTVSTFFDPNFAGAFLILTLLSLMGYSAKQPKDFYIIFSLVYLALLTTFSRSSYLMFLVSGLTFSLLKKSKILFIVTILLFLGLMLGFKTYTQVVAEPRNINRGQSASFRFNTWQQGLTLFQKSPILGVGFNAYRYGIRQYNLGGNQFLTSHGSSSNDSSLLFVLSTTGIIGLAAYLFFLWSLIKEGLKQNLILSAGIAGLIIHSIFANSLFYPPILLWLLSKSVTPKK